VADGVELGSDLLQQRIEAGGMICRADVFELSRRQSGQRTPSPNSAYLRLDEPALSTSSAVMEMRW
jgi:hypothetical protein